jgi:hypothetical protein
MTATISPRRRRGEGSLARVQAGARLHGEGGRGDSRTRRFGAADVADAGSGAEDVADADLRESGARRRWRTRRRRRGLRAGGRAARGDLQPGTCGIRGRQGIGSGWIGGGDRGGVGVGGRARAESAEAGDGRGSLHSTLNS